MTTLSDLVSPRDTNHPLPAVLRLTFRFLLRAWSRFPKATGYLSEIIERWGGRLATRPLECCISNGMKMKCDLTDHVQRQIYFRGSYEPIETYLYQLLLRPGMVVIDAGANVGQYALFAAGVVGHGGEVHAFEPVPRSFQRLEAHVLKNGLAPIVRTNMSALWHREEALVLHLARDMWGNDGAYSLGMPLEAIDTVAAAGICLDDYVARSGITQLDFVKMDIEGAEWFALLGARSTIERWKPMMLLEINRDACGRLGYQPEQIWELLKPYGYRMWVIGQSADASHQVDSLADLDRVNVILHLGTLPDNVTMGWTLKSVLRHHRRIGISRHRAE